MPEIGLDGPGIDAIVRQLLRKLAAGLSRFEPERSRRWRRRGDDAGGWETTCSRDTVLHYLTGTKPHSRRV